MRILMLTQWFQPEQFFKGLPFAKELANLGHEVEVLTGFPNYPGGKVYDGYKIKFFQRELIEGIPVLRVPLYPSHNTSAIQRIANYLSFAVFAATLGTWLVKPADVMYVYHPPATIGLPALMLHLMRRIPFVYDIQDLWPDTLPATGMLDHKMALWCVEQWCRFIYSQAARIVVLSPGFKEILTKRGVPSDKIEIIYNWCEDSQIQTSGRNEALSQKLGLTDRFNILFAGTMGKAQALDAVLDAASLIAERLPKIQFVFVGGGVELSRLKQKVNDHNLRNILFLPRMPVSEIGAVLNLADVLLVHLKDDPLFSITIPSKTQAYMAAGRPILMGVRGDAQALVEEAGAGLACKPEDAQSIAAAVAQFFTMPRAALDQMGNNGKRFYERELAMNRGVKRFEELFKAVVRSAKSRCCTPDK